MGNSTTAAGAHIPERESLPAELTAVRGWLTWRYEHRSGESKPRKVPYYAPTGRLGAPDVPVPRQGPQGSLEDRAGLVSFDEARDAALRFNFSGVGLAMLPEWGLVGLDFDNCFEKLDVETFNALTAGTYREISPSGKGARTFYRGALADGKDRDRERIGKLGGFEVFHAKGFLTVTGNVLDETHDLIGPFVAELPDNVRQYAEQRHGKREILKTADEAGLGSEDISDEQYADLRAALAHIAACPEAGTNEFWSNEIGYRLRRYGEKGLALWLEFSAAAPNGEPGAAELWWNTHKNAHGNAAHIFTVARRLGWSNPRISRASQPRDFEDVSERVMNVEPAGTQAPASAERKRFVPIPVDQFVGGPEPEWIIDGIMPRSELMVVYGEPGCGKSFFVADMAAAIARGVPWCDREVQQGCVVYVCAESASGFRLRWRAYTSAHGLSVAELGRNLFMITDAPNLLSIGDVGELCERLRALGIPLALIVIDTLARATPGANENSGEDMGKALAHCKAIHTATGALVCLVHHSGKDQARGARGWSGIRGATDTEIEITRQAGMVRQAVVNKQRDGEDGMKLEFQLVTAGAGLNAKGEPRTSLIVQPVDPRRESVSPIKRPTGVAQRAIWDSLGSAMRVMTTDELITAAVSRLVYDPAGGRDRRREIARRAIETMLSNGMLVQDGPGYNLPRPVEFQSAIDDASDLIGVIEGYRT